MLGRDTDAAFHGITSLKHIFNQIKDNNILELKINDYADVKGRGFIEGYYGNPWSNEDRADVYKRQFNYCFYYLVSFIWNLLFYGYETKVV